MGTVVNFNQQGRAVRSTPRRSLYCAKSADVVILPCIRYERTEMRDETDSMQPHVERRTLLRRGAGRMTKDKAAV